jgi:hypothetical protein
MNETTKRSPVSVHGHHPVDRDVDVTVNMKCEVYQEESQGCFCATLIREETRFWDDDPEPDIIETIVCETQLQLGARNFHGGGRMADPRPPPHRLARIMEVWRHGARNRCRAPTVRAASAQSSA